MSSLLLPISRPWDPSCQIKLSGNFETLPIIRSRLRPLAALYRRASDRDCAGRQLAYRKTLGLGSASPKFCLPAYLLNGHHGTLRRTHLDDWKPLPDSTFCIIIKESGVGSLLASPARSVCALCLSQGLFILDCQGGGGSAE